MSGPFFIRLARKMLLEFEKKVAGFIKAERLFEGADRILLAVSGGADSTALLYVACALKKRGMLENDFICAHINHQLRGSEADGDEDFSIRQAEELGVATVTRRIDVRGFAQENKLSIETAARKVRLESLLEVADSNGCQAIATAHHKDDNAETMVQRLARGTGFRGLGGIWPMRKFRGELGFVRPLLCVRRDEIIEYLKRRNLKWRQDHTNADCTYRRNYIRHRLIPELQRDYDDSVVEDLFNLSQSARKLYKLIYRVADEVWPKVAEVCNEKLSFDLGVFLVQHTAVKVELARRALVMLGSGEMGLTQEHYERILQLARGGVSGRKVELPQGFVVGYEYGRIVFYNAENRRQIGREINGSKEVEVPGRTRFGKYLVEAAVFEADIGAGRFKAGKTSFVEWFDLDKLNQPLVVRQRRVGDRFVPLGSKSEKKVGKFLTDQRVLQRIREKTLIVCDCEKIVWLWPIRMSEQAKITEATRKILRLQITDTNNE